MHSLFWTLLVDLITNPPPPFVGSPFFLNFNFFFFNFLPFSIKSPETVKSIVSLTRGLNFLFVMEPSVFLTEP